MSERKVLQKYYPPDFDPSKIARSRVPKNAGPKVMTVRLMAPFSMKCISCGEYIYKGRKFNSRKETTDEKYLNIPIYRFYIRCTRCSAEITFKTDPKGMDYTCERGAKRNFEVWRKADGEDDDHKLETDEERLDRLEAEEAERGAMEVLEGKVVDAKREMEIADALDEIRTRNARIQRAEGKGEVDKALEQAERARAELELEKRRVEAEDEEAARRAFGRGIEIDEGVEGGVGEGTDMAGDGMMADGGVSEVPAAKGATVGSMPPPEFKRVVKKKKDFSAALGIKKKPALV
ncbi:hypothetical protein HO133_005526 [Letharia lupina]|uniref:Splicing factor YJU2 n=1 Tax=Letharia lupina TaxID=560253 RepID=A0A8H6C8S0_9LECA|nr:uncharacterized protein HO133_005526 [Letharia lupina]KAF6218982.1 hypothetical protein HO133_005526 [Letharia lupina]